MRTLRLVIDGDLIYLFLQTVKTILGERVKTVNLIKQYGDPDNFYATDGYQYAKDIVNNVSAEKYILPFLETDGQDVAETIENWTRSILTKIY